MDVTKIPKILCENISMAYSPEYFVMVLNSMGNNPTAYGLTPQHTKRLHQYLEAQLKEYENKYGKIDAKWEPGIQSPIQTNDLKNSDGKNNGKAKK